MKIFLEKQNFKKIVIATLIVLMFNFMTPICSRAEAGGKLFEPIVQLLSFVADLAIELLQEFLWDGSNINEETNYQVYIRTSNNICRKNTSD